MEIFTRDLHHTLFSKGFRNALSLAVIELRLCWRHRLSIREARTLATTMSELRLNLGCGPNLRRGWINIDLFDSKADLHLDLREEWPFGNDSVVQLYSEHVLEHFEFPHEVTHFMAESLRVLRPGGVVDIGVPDSEWPLRAYGDDANNYWRLAKELWHPAYCETHLDHINYHFSQAGEHKYAWDEETLTKLFRKSGFGLAQKRCFDPALDAESRRLGTLYLRAWKPSE